MTLVKCFLGSCEVNGAAPVLCSELRYALGTDRVSLREHFEAVARSVRDVLSQRWIRTEQTYDRENPKRIYYLSIEFLLGRSLANNIENLPLDPITKQLIKDKNLDWLGLLEQEPDLGLG